MTGIIYGPPKNVKTLAEFIDSISKKTIENSTDNYEIRYLYRGHSSEKYELCPSIARYKHSIRVEERLIEKAKNRLPDTFSDSDSKLTTLSKMQHYGLPTRLIDFTSNPLVALFFACQDAFERDNGGNELRDKPLAGEVIESNEHIHCSGKKIIGHFNLLYQQQIQPDIQSEEGTLYRYSLRYYSDEIVKELILSCIDVVTDAGIKVADFIERIKVCPWFENWAVREDFYSLSGQQREKCIVALLKSPIIVEAQESIERQRIQQGKYMLIANEVKRDEYGSYIIQKELPKLYHKEHQKVGRYIVDPQYKKAILRDLDKIGINEGFLFGDSIDLVCKQIKTDICR